MEEGKKHSWKTEGHYTKDGKEWKGLQHAHDGQVMTGAEHTDDSQNLYHFKELSPDVQKKVLARMKLKEDLRKWFGKGKKGDWVRVGTDGEIKGDCAREPGEGKPKCMPRSKAHSMDKKDRASAARRKRAADPEVDRPGTGNKPIMVKTDKKKKMDEELISEKNVPTNPALWAKWKAAAKRKFDVYPSAYANGWAAKMYKKDGGGWKSVKEENELQEKSDYQIYHKDFSSAVQHAIKQAEKKGYKVDMDDWWNKVSTGPRKPSAGKTNSYSINLLDKSGKPIRNKRLNMQVYNMDNKGYELNMYTEEFDSETGGHEWGTKKSKKYAKKMTPGEKVDEAKYSVDVEGLPKFYMDGDSPGQVKVAIRKLLKKASSLQDVARVNDAKIRKDLRDRLSGKTDVEGSEQVDEAKKMKRPNKTAIAKVMGPTKNIEQAYDAVMKKYKVNKETARTWVLDVYTDAIKGFSEEVEQVDEAKVPAGMKFMDGLVYKGTRHTYYRKGNKMTDPVVVHIDGKMWKEFGSLPKAKEAALAHIKSMKEEFEQVDEASLKMKIAKRGRIETALQKMKNNDDAQMAAFLINQGDEKELMKFLRTADPKVKKLVNDMMKEEQDPLLADENPVTENGQDVAKLDEKSVSKAQQRFMGMVHAVKSGKLKAPSKEVADAAKSMSKKDAKDYAETKHKGLPEKK